MKRWNMIRMLISPSRDFGFVSHTMPTSKSHPVPAFYNANEPLLLSMLSSQTEICYQPKTPVCVSAMEEIVISQLPMAVLPTTNTRSTTKMVCMSTPGTSSRATTPREVIPTTKPLGKGAEKSVTIIKSHRARSDSPSSMESSLLSLNEEQESDRKRIPKPSGEVGQLGRGGYNWEDQLGWGKDGCKKLKVIFSCLVEFVVFKMVCRDSVS